MSTASIPEAWLRGPVAGFEPMLMPVVHALVQVREDVERLSQEVPFDHVWARTGSAAPLGFHIRHLGGALDRLFTYARGESLSDVQKAAMKSEQAHGEPLPTMAELAAEVRAIVDRSLDQLRATSAATLLVERRVGRAGLPSTVIGLLFHAAEHSTRHVGQAITTARMLRN